MKTYSKTLFENHFNFLTAYGSWDDDHSKMEGYIEFKMHFDFKEGLRFSVAVPDYGYCTRNPFKALFNVLETQIVGNGKYQRLKADCRDKGYWQHLE